MLLTMTARELGRRLQRRELSCLEVADAFLDRISQHDSQLHAFLQVDPDRTRAWALAAQDMIDRGEGGPLTGVPVAIKDNLHVRGWRTTCGSRMLANYVAVYDATVVERMLAQGLVPLGKTNLDEFAMGTSTETSAFGPTRNPWDLGRSPGGSSGGSAAAVAAGLAPLGLGSDTGGSIRQPAALCGIVGFKPTYGRCSRYGLTAFGSSLDQIGPFARSVDDAALLAEAITGHDHRDSTSLQDSKIRAGTLEPESLRGVRMGVVREAMEGSTDSVRATIEEAVDVLRSEGTEVGEVSLNSIRYGISTYYIIAPAEASSNLARYDGIRYGGRVEGAGHVGQVAATRGQLFGHEVKCRIMVGTYALSAGYYDAYYARAQQVRAMMTDEFDRAFVTYDFLLGPTSPIPAFPIGSLSDDPMALKRLDYCTIPANLGGFPAISLNCGYVEGLPVGLQLMAPRRADERLLRVAELVETALPQARAELPPMFADG